MQALEAIRGEEASVRWLRIRSGLYETSDSRFRALGGQETGDYDGWWLARNDGTGWTMVEPYATLRDAKNEVAREYGAEEAKRRELWIDEAVVEAGSGTIHRLRLMQGDVVMREIIVRNGRLAAVRTAYLRDKTEWGMGAEEARALATMMMRAADLIGDD